jgi:hypothetical protein
MNPPYGRDIYHWTKKAYESKCLVVGLIPVRSDTRFWHEHVMKAAEIRFIQGKVIFEGARAGAPFPVAIVVWRPRRPKLKVSSITIKEPIL